MEIIQIRCEAQSFDCALNVVLNVRGRIVDCSVLENSNATFRRHCYMLAELVHQSLLEVGLTKDLIADVMLPDKVAQNLLIHTVAVGDLENRSAGSGRAGRSPTRTAVSQKVQPNSNALRSTGSACSYVKLFPSAKLMPMAPKPGTGTSTSAKRKVLTMTAIGIACVRYVRLCMMMLEILCFVQSVRTISKTSC
jgi:hypothetical protein